MVNRTALRRLILSVVLFLSGMAPIIGALPQGASAQGSPELTDFPTSGSAGSTVTVSGSEFVPNENVTLFFVPDSADQFWQYNDVPADQNGQFSTSLTLPSGIADGSYYFSALEDGADFTGNPVATVDFTVGDQQSPPPTCPTPSVSISPSEVTVGASTTVTLSGQNWLPDGQIVLTADGQSANLTTVGSDGTWDYSSGNSAVFSADSIGAYTFEFSESTASCSLDAAATLTVNPAASPPPPATYIVSGTVYVDANSNGVQDSGEAGYGGATVTVGGQSTTSNSSGVYTLANVTSGTYTETLSVPSGYHTTTSNPVTISVSANTTVNFGIEQPPQSSSQYSVHLMLQAGQSYSGDPLGNNPEGIWTIGYAGCAVTSLAMVLQAHGATLPDGTAIDPGTLNKWLTDNQVKGTGVNAFEKGDGNLVGWNMGFNLIGQEIETTDPGTDWKATLRSDVAQGPTIVELYDSISPSNYHFVVVTSQAGSGDFNIMDPEGLETELSEYLGTTGSPIKIYTTKSTSTRDQFEPFNANLASSAALLSDQDESSTTIYMPATGTLTVLDAQGRSDSVSGSGVVINIPGSVAWYQPAVSPSSGDPSASTQTGVYVVIIYRTDGEATNYYVNAIAPTGTNYTVTAVNVYPTGNGTGQETPLTANGTTQLVTVPYDPASSSPSSLAPAEQPANPIPGCTYFPQTQHNLCGGFQAYWNKFGGLAVFGYPLTEEFQQNGVTTQYFERARFEWHPGSWSSHYDVELGLLGDEVTSGRSSEPAFQPAQPEDASGCVYYPETQHNLCGGFKAYFDQYGGLAVYGYPISEEFQEVNPDTGKTYTVQYFERQRFEWHPGEWPERFDVELGRLGAQELPR